MILAPWPQGRRVTLILHKFSRGGSDRVAAHLANGFARRGMRVDLIVLCRGGETEAILTSLIRTDIPVRFLGTASRSRPLDLVRHLPALVRALRGDGPRYLISTANNTALLSAIALRLSGLRGARLFLKTTNPVAGSRHRGLAARIRHGSYRLIFRWCTAVWTLSAEESAAMRTAFPDFATKFREIANPYVTTTMLAPAEERPPSPVRTVITVARLTRQKRLERLISAFALIEDPAVRLVILGEGEERQALTDLVARRGIGDRVAMPGYADDVVPWLHQADLFVLTSDYEGLPAGVLEAMAANCPVIGTDCFPSARTLLSAEGCAVIEDVEPGPLARQIRRHLDEPRPARLRDVAMRYSIESGVESHIAAMNEIGGGAA